MRLVRVLRGLICQFSLRSGIEASIEVSSLLDHFRLSWRPLVCTSSSMADKAAVNKMLSELGAARMSNAWSDDVTHLVMDEIILTIKGTSTNDVRTERLR